MEVYERILVVDNEPEFAEALRMTLHAKSYQVVTAGNKAQAEEKVSKEEFDAVVVGTITPRGDAFAFHQWLKKNPKTKDLPFLVIDARPERRLVEGWRRDEGMQLEADDYVTKPIEPAMLVPRIQRLLEKAAERIRVLVVDDHTVVRDGIRAVLFNLYLLRLGYDPGFVGLVNAVGMLVFSILVLFLSFSQNFNNDKRNACSIVISLDCEGITR